MTTKKQNKKLYLDEANVIYLIDKHKLPKQKMAEAAKAANKREAEIAKAYLNAGPNISNLAKAAYHWYNSMPMLGGQNENGNIYITGEPPAVGIKNFDKVLKVATLTGMMERGLSKTKDAAKVARAYANQAWSNFLTTKNGDAYYRMSKAAETGKKLADEKFFISHTTPWEEFSGRGTDTEIGIKHLYEFPTKTFGKLEATTDKGVKTGKDVTEIGKSHLLYGDTASGKRGKVRVLSDKNAQLLDMDSHIIGNIERPLKANGFYDSKPFYEDIYQGNQTVVKGSQLNDAVLNTDYKVYSQTPLGIQTKIHLGPWASETTRKVRKYGGIVSTRPSLKTGGKINKKLTDAEYISKLEEVAKNNYNTWGFNNEDEALLHVLNDHTYDYRGYYNKYPNSKANAETHWPDEFKTYLHPTFSSESRYSGKKSEFNPNGLQGGTWIGDRFLPQFWQLLRPSLKSGGSIYIKPSHRGRLTELKARTGKSES